MIRKIDKALLDKLDQYLKSPQPSDNRRIKIDTGLKKRGSSINQQAPNIKNLNQKYQRFNPKLVSTKESIYSSQRATANRNQNP